MTPTKHDPSTFAHLLRQAADGSDPKETWLLLEAAHVVGQGRFGAHLRVHARMLRLACRTRDWPEAVGQVARLALTPLGHVTGRLPWGNPGRATVSAFAPLPVRPALAERIAAARRDARDHAS